MKQIGFVLIAVGIALIVFVLINGLRERNQIKSPVPEDKGIKVIFISPTK